MLKKPKKLKRFPTMTEKISSNPKVRRHKSHKSLFGKNLNKEPENKKENQLGG